MSKNKYIAKDIIYLDRIDSTNDFLKRQISDGRLLETGTLVIAKEQYKGRGYRNNVWVAEKHKNLTLSFFMCFDLPVQKTFLINQLISLAIHKFLASKAPDVSFYLKWPNDIICQHKKIGGVLIENSVKANVVTQSIVGIGLNINQQEFAATSALQPMSLSIATGKSYDIMSCTLDLASNIDKLYAQFVERGAYPEYEQTIKEQYESLLYRRNQECCFEDVSNGYHFKGVLVGVSEIGELLVLDQHAQCKKFAHKRIRLIK